MLVRQLRVLLLSLRQMEKRHQREEESTADDQSNASRKRTKKEFDCDRARMCVCQDHIGPDPLFGRQFECVFRVTRAIFQKV